MLQTFASAQTIALITLSTMIYEIILLFLTEIFSLESQGKLSRQLHEFECILSPTNYMTLLKYALYSCKLN